MNPFGPLPVVTLAKREVRSVACGAGATIATVATEWMRDAEAHGCMRCDVIFSSFSLARRRHHCRHCGGVFCDRCSSKKISLLRLGYVSPVRVCDSCFTRLSAESAAY